MRRIILVLPLLLAADWPQWLGPTRDGRSTEKIKPWGKDDLKKLWSQKVGAGHSSPIIAGGKVFLHTQDGGKDGERLSAFDAKTGKPLWSTAYPRGPFFSPFGFGPQATPLHAEGKVYTFGVTGRLTAFDAEKGEQLWQVEVEKEFKAKRLFFGASCSPLIEEGKIVIQVGGKDGAGVVAFDAAKGTTAWKSLDDGASYASGIAVGATGKRELVFLTQEGVRGLAPKDGKKLWGFPLKDKLNEASVTPVQAGGLLLASSITFGTVGLKVEGEKVERKWMNRALKGYFSTPIPVGKHVYLVTGKASLLDAESTLHCVDLKTGEPTWSKAKVGKYHAAMLRTADDKLLMLTDFGELILLQPDPKEYKELARAKVTKVESIWAHPALSDGRVYIRDDKELICLQMPE